MKATKKQGESRQDLKPRLLQIAILVPDHAIVETITESRYMLLEANKLHKSRTGNDVFKVELVGTKRSISLYNDTINVKVDRQLQNAMHPDIVIIPSLFIQNRDIVAANREILPWVIKNYRKGSEVVSLCAGAFLLASTGLLNGKRCSLHWAYYNQFQALYPQVKIANGAIITEDQRLLSSGGANSYWNLLLYIIEKYTNRETAVWISKYFAIDIDRVSQAKFAIFEGNKQHDDNDIRKCQELIESKYHTKITLDTLANEISINKRSFERRFKKATSLTAMEYLKRVRIEVAKHLLETTNKRIEDIITQIGYNDPKMFRSVFKNLCGLSPQHYRKTYNS